MKTRNGAIVALLALATCSEQSPDPSSSVVESAARRLGKIPSSEAAVWQKVGATTTPDARYLQAATFDSDRKMVVMFGGTNLSPNTGMAAPNQETWDWSTATGKWANRTGAGSAPDARSGAVMVYDSKRAKVILFGGRAGSGYNYEDTWEWDPTTGIWTDVTNAGSHPSGRSQAGMVYETSTGKILLFGGGRSDANSYDGTGAVVSLADTWEFDPTTHVWSQLSTTAAPSARHDFGLVWDSARNKAVLFGGMQIDMSGVTGIPKQDSWEWDPATGTWSERTSQGSKPAARYGHAMAYDGKRAKIVVFGGFDIATGGSLSDVWDWDPTTGSWSQRMTGAETGMPTARRYASLLSDDARGQLELVAGMSNYDPYKGGTGGIIMPPIYYGSTGSNEVWELDPVKPAFKDRTAPLDVPVARWGHSMAYYPPTGKTYLFGGVDQMGRLYDDFWVWDGKVWAQVTADVRPQARSDSAMAYDPARKALILYSGNNNTGGSDDTWEWTEGKGWLQLKVATTPGPLSGHGMVTDTTRNKILMWGGMSSKGYAYAEGGAEMMIRNPYRTEVWEWDGSTSTWTNRTPSPSSSSPSGRQDPLLAYDEGQKKLFLYDGSNYSGDMSTYWEWDPLSAGWAKRSSSEYSLNGYASLATYDSTRRREVLLVQSYSTSTGISTDDTWELDARNQTWYARNISSPPTRYSAGIAFDSARGVVVVFGGQLNAGGIANDTWEYKVSGLGNGEGCTSASAATCASGFCVEGVCCEASSCGSACKSCNVLGHEGTCTAAKAGTEVPGSCSSGEACDGKGNCMAQNGKACTSATTCASGFCVDGVCCDTGCDGTCMACNQAGRVGKCSPYESGSDPQNECGKGTGVCKSTCDGANGCAFPSTAKTCDKCMMCDGYGSCSYYDYYCSSRGGTGGWYPTGGAGGYVYPTGGSGGYVYPTGGSGGRVYPTGGTGGYSSRGGAGGTIPFGGSGGYSSRGGAGGTIPFGGSGGYSSRGGAGGTIPFGGSGGTIPFGSGGSVARGGAGGSAGGGAMSGGAVGVGGTSTGGTVAVGGVGGGVGGSGGKLDGGYAGNGGRDGGSPDGVDLITEARLHRSGCSCELGGTTDTGSSLTLALGLSALGLILVRRRRRRD
jgi:MYXO-CTERM domain-containing protein